MIKLYIEKDSVEKLADLNKDEAVTLTTQINDFEAISSALAPHTLQFTIPCSDVNNSILKQYSKIDVSSSIDPHQSINARLVIGELMDIKGGIEVKGFSWENGKPQDYKIVFYGQEFNIKTLLSKQLNQIDWSDYDYELTHANMKLSWLGTLNDGKVLLPVMSYVRDYLYQSAIYQGQNHPDNIGNNTAYYEENDSEFENPILPGIRLDELKTAVKLQSMVETIYADVGIDVTWGTTIEDYLSNVFVIPSKEAGKAKNESVTQVADVLVVKYDALAYQSLAINPTWTTINMPTIVQDSGEPTSFWSSDTTFTAKTSGIHKFELIYRDANPLNCFKGGDFPISQDVRFRAYKNGNTVFGDVSSYVACSVKRNVYFEGYLDNGDTLVFQGQTDSTAAMQFRFYQVTMQNSPTSFYGQTTAIGDNMPEMIAYDFLKGFMATFNLMQVIELTEMGGELNVQSVKLIDKDEFYTTGTVRDWTTYVSTGKRVYDKPQIDKDLILKYAEYNDKVNIAFFRDALRNYAQLNYQSDADFTGKDLDNTSIFTVFPPSYLNYLDGYGQPQSSTDLLIHSQFDNDGKAINSDFLIFMYNGEVDITNTYYIQSGIDSNGDPTFVGQPEDSLPYCSTQEFYPSNKGYALNYTVETPADSNMEKVALNTAAKVFFENYLQNLYSAQSKILTVDAIIPLSEMTSFKLNDTIEIQGIRYVVDTMKRNLLTGLTKLKLFNYNAGLTYTKPSSYQNSGEVVFDAVPNINTLSTYNAKTNSAISGQYIWNDYRVKIQQEDLVTQKQTNFKALTKAQGEAVATSGAFTISTSITNTLTIYDTVSSNVKVIFNGLPIEAVTHNAVRVTHSGEFVSYSASFPGRIYVYEAGSYQFSSTTNFSVATLPQQVKFILAINGTNYFLNPVVAANVSGTWDITMNATVPLSVGDYIELYIYGDISQAYTINSATTKLNRI